ncbi:MAG: hypothetical protein M1823_009025, partial [Watsoniomyces obsoletus]
MCQTRRARMEQVIKKTGATLVNRAIPAPAVAEPASATVVDHPVAPPAKMQFVSRGLCGWARMPKTISSPSSAN